MASISYKNLKPYLEHLKKPDLSPVYLIFGEEFLCKTSLEAVLNRLAAETEEASRNYSYEPVDGASGNIREAIAKLNTYSLFSRGKVVAILDSNVFSSKTDDEPLIRKAKDAFDANDMKAAAGSFLGWMSVSRISFEDIRDESRRKAVKTDLAGSGNSAWIDSLIDYCLENNLKIPEIENDARVLEDAIQKGFPPGNRLIITAVRADRRTGLFKAILQYGTVIDCAIPLGERYAEKAQREAVLKDVLNAVMTPANKTIGKEAFAALCDMTGFDLKTVKQSLEKLIHYSGSRPEITVTDVEAVLSRTRQDPIYSLTNAILEKNSFNALFFLDALLKIDFHHMQILSAVVNQIRKLIVVNDFTSGSEGKTWRAGCEFVYFKESVIPDIMNYDKKIPESAMEWDITTLPAGSGSERKGKSGKKQVSDLGIIRNPQNPYPVYMLFKAAEKFTRKMLFEALESLREADRQLKTTSRNPKFVLERVILGICRKEQ
ncbi:MAG: hypothetical protein A2V65_01030 [Deltaproteobacteria bacterium RBG_13_49_15]|nr:MAG: hypothetical protein A2V65_01030 [Deltaproteobacteria bacterium RBG_13_49_15]